MHLHCKGRQARARGPGISRADQRGPCSYRRCIHILMPRSRPTLAVHANEGAVRGNTTRVAQVRAVQRRQTINQQLVGNGQDMHQFDRHDDQRTGRCRLQQRTTQLQFVTHLSCVLLELDGLFVPQEPDQIEKRFRRVKTFSHGCSVVYSRPSLCLC